MFDKPRYPLKVLQKKYEDNGNLVLKNFIEDLEKNVNIINLENETTTFIPDDSWFYIRKENNSQSNIETSVSLSRLNDTNHSNNSFQTVASTSGNYASTSASTSGNYNNELESD